MSKPNVLFIFSDQQRHDTVSCYGEPLGADLRLTPNIDALARQGVRFDNAFSAQPVCGPARACIQTGLWPTELGCHVNSRMLPPDSLTIASLFHDSGYATAYVGKWHLASQYCYDPGHPEQVNYQTTAIPPELRGGYRDHWVASDVLEYTSHGYGGYMHDGGMNRRVFEHFRADATADYALEYLRQPKDRPFFLFVSFIEPHHQNDHEHYEGPHGSHERFANYTVPGDLTGTQGDWRQEMPDYLGCCASLDDNVGRIVACLKEQGLYDNTVILYTSDHGSHFKTRNAEYKRSCHDASLHVPLIARGPGFPAGAVSQAMVSTIDMAPTMLHAAGIPIPAAMHGMPVQALLGPDAVSRPQEVFVQISESCIGRALRTPQWTYCVEAPDAVPRHLPDSDTYCERYLYDLQNDPHQRHNLVADPAYAAIRAGLRTRLETLIAQHEGKPALIVADA